MWLEKHVGEYLKDEADVDLLLEYQKSSIRNSIQEKDFNSAENFNDTEKVSIKLGLEQVKLLINERFKLTEAQLHVLDERLIYLSVAVDRLNKIDYKGIFINTIISLMITLNLDTQKGQELYHLFMQVIQLLPVLPHSF